MLSTDTEILNILLKAKKEGNPLLELFEIKYPDKTINMDTNSIHVACLSTENNEKGLDYQTFTDLVEVIITTKQLEYHNAVRVIKTVSNEIINLCKQDAHLGNRLTVRSISPIHDSDTYLLKKGHILFQFITEPVTWDNNSDELYKVCEILINDVEMV